MSPGGRLSSAGGKGALGLHVHTGVPVRVRCRKTAKGDEKPLYRLNDP